MSIATSKENQTYSLTETIVTIRCCACSVLFGMPQSLKDRCQKDTDRSFYCPNGHGMTYKKSTLQIEKERLESTIDTIRIHNAELTEKLLTEMSAKKKAQKELKRAQLGVCTCCNRTFTNLQRHMETKHPEVVHKPTGILPGSVAQSFKKRGRPRKESI